MTVTPAENEVLIDSLLHSDKRRIAMGVVSGVLAGVVLLLVSMIFTPFGANKLWFVQLMASSVFGGSAFAFDPAPGVMAAGFVVHFLLAVINGLVFAKMTTSKSAKRLAGYGLVLGGLCWLASNMFGPDVLNFQGLQEVGEWSRVFMFVPFGVSLGLFMAALAPAGVKARTQV